MSQNFAAFFPLKPYIGQPVPQAMELGRFDTILKNAQLLSILGANGAARGKKIPSFVPIAINWTSYGAATALPNVGVLLDLSGSNPGQIIDKIQSVYIDNTNSVVPIYVTAPDSGHTVVAQPFSAGWHPIVTLNKVLWIFGKGFTDGQIPQTLIFVTSLDAVPYTNIELPQTVQLWKSSALIQRGNSIYQSNYASPALGDQTQQFNMPFTNGGTQIIFSTPLAAGFIYLTGLSVFLQGFNGGIAGFSDAFYIESTGVSGILYQQFVTANNSIPFGGAFVFNSSVGMQVKLDATQTWRIRMGPIAVAGFGLVFVFHFSTNPI